MPDRPREAYGSWGALRVADRIRHPATGGQVPAVLRAEPPKIWRKVATSSPAASVLPSAAEIAFSFEARRLRLQLHSAIWEAGTIPKQKVYSDAASRQMLRWAQSGRLYRMFLLAHVITAHG